ncbi:YpbF family protein [Bacillus nitroreducens]
MGGSKIEKQIRELNEYTDEVTKQMLQHSVEKKRKYETLKARSYYMKLVALFLLAIFLVYVYRTLILPYSYSTELMIRIFLDESIYFIFVFIIGGLYGGIRYVDKKKDEAEDKYHAIRREIVDKSKDLWKEPEQWRERQHVFEMMKKEFDVNLYHESK